MRNDMWMIICYMIVCVVCWLGLMKVFSRWIDEMLISVIDSLIFSMFVFMWLSYLGLLGWFLMLSCDMNVLYLLMIIMISRFEIIIMLIRLSMVSIMLILLRFVVCDSRCYIFFRNRNM